MFIFSMVAYCEGICKQNLCNDKGKCITVYCCGTITKIYCTIKLSE